MRPHEFGIAIRRSDVLTKAASEANLELVSDLIRREHTLIGGDVVHAVVCAVRARRMDIVRLCMSVAEGSIKWLWDAIVSGMFAAIQSGYVDIATQLFVVADEVIGDSYMDVFCYWNYRGVLLAKIVMAATKESVAYECLEFLVDRFPAKICAAGVDAARIRAKGLCWDRVVDLLYRLAP